MTKHYLNNTMLNGRGHLHNYTKAQVEEIIKCRDDIDYFAETYFTIINIDHGKMLIPLYEYQSRLLKQLQENRFNICCQCRQSGKSTTLTVFILHHILFNNDKTVAILANKGDTSQEILARIQMAFELLPNWLKPNVVTWNKRTCEFENGCSIIARATSSSSIRGLSISTLVVDEAAHVENWEEFYTSTYSTIASGKNSRVILISTMKGMNHFHHMREAARRGHSDFKLFEVIWSDVPGRDEEWRQQTISNTSVEAFAQEHENMALGSSKTLIPISVLQNMVIRDPLVFDNDMKYYYEPDDTHNYVVTVDTSRGKGLDFSVATVWDCSRYPLMQVAQYRSDTISPLVYPNIIYQIATQYNHAWVLVETNDMGESIVNALNYDLEYEFIINEKVDGDARTFDPLGVKTTKKTKRIGCNIMKNLLEMHQLVICDETTQFEMANFVAKGSSYEADVGFHDDCVATTFMLAWYTTTEAFTDMMNQDVKFALYENKLRQLEEDMVPFGILHDPSGEEEEEILVEGGERWAVMDSSRY